MLIMLSLGIIAVLGASLKYRLEDHPIVMHIAPQAMRPAPAAGSAPDAGREGGMSKQGLDAMAEAMQNDPEQAAMIDLMQKMQANPNDPDALLDLADMFMRRGDLERAENFINRQPWLFPPTPARRSILAFSRSVRANTRKPRNLWSVPCPCRTIPPQGSASRFCAFTT